MLENKGVFIMKLVKLEQAQECINSNTSKLLEYSIALNDKDIDLYK